MRLKICSRKATRRVPWLAAAVLAAVAVAPATASAASSKGEPVTWATYHPHGWSAGSVKLGTGFVRPGASRRVREVQRRLNRLGYGAGKVDGLFGPITDAAVRRYQRGHALAVDGIVGPRTLKDLRTRTRRASGAENRAGSTQARQSTARDAVASPEPTSNWPAWWKVALIVGASALCAFIAATLLLRRPRRERRPVAPAPAVMEDEDALYLDALDMPEGTPGEAEAALAEELALLAVGSGQAGGSQVTSISAWRDREQAMPATRSQTTPEGNGLRIVRRIEEPARAPGGGNGSKGNGAPSEQRSGGPRFPKRFGWLGARVHLAEEDGRAPVPGTLPVMLELFAENAQRRWETGLIETDEPFTVSADDLEDGVRALVVPELPAFAEALERDGVSLDVEQLARLPFAVELSVEVERALAERRHSERG